MNRAKQVQDQLAKFAVKSLKEEKQAREVGDDAEWV
jgi:hypothetical protein